MAGAQLVDLDAVALDELEHEDAQARGRAADLERRAGEVADDDAADDAGDYAGRGRHAGRNRYAHAERQGDQKHDDGS